MTSWKSLSLLALLALCSALRSPVKLTDTDTMPPKASSFPTSTAMYEISTRPWLYQLSQKYGTTISTLEQIPDSELQWIQKSGFTIVWMMGVWSLGEYGLNYDKTNPGLLQYYPQVLPSFNIADVIGSPYAVTNYTCNPQLCPNGDSDLWKFKQRLNDMGLSLMLDFVPNHSAVDCPWTTSNPAYYVRVPKGTQPPYDANSYLPNGIAFGSACGANCGSWPDTAQFNYWNPDARAARLKELMHVASLSDAIRCDMAYLLLNDLIQQNWNTQLSSWGYTRPTTEWWSDAIGAVKSKYPEIIFLAEVYSPWQQNLQAVGFDYTYDKTLYDKLANGDLNDIRSWLTQNPYQFHQHSAHFISNHDEPRAAQFFGSWWRADATALVMFTMPGMKFYYMWDYYGFANRLDVHLRREQAESNVSDVMAFYNTLYPIVNSDVFNLGTWTYLNVFGTNDCWRLFAYRYEYNGQRRLVVINYSDTQGTGNIILSNAQSNNGNDTIPVTDLLSGTVWYRSASQMRSQGLFVIINSWYAQIIQY